MNTVVVFMFGSYLSRNEELTVFFFLFLQFGEKICEAALNEIDE